MTRSVKKVLAIHDLCAHGRVSLKVVTTILTSMGLEIYPLPTALMSAHTQYPEFTFLDLTDQMQPILDNWKKLGVTFDAIYTGYLGSPRQVDIVQGAIRDFGREGCPIIIDPVMGDNGRLYTGFDDNMVREMRRLVTKADIITPNLTEVAFLLDKPYQTEYSDEEIKGLLRELAALGPKQVVITGVPVKGREDRISVWSYEKATEAFARVEKPFLPAHLPGTGDGFASVLTGSLVRGEPMDVAIDRAAQFIVDGIQETLNEGENPLDGMLMEKVLPTLRRA